MTTDEMEEIKREFLDVLLEACDGWVYPDKYTLSDNINPQVWDWIESKLKAKDTALEKQREGIKELIDECVRQFSAEWGDVEVELEAISQYRTELELKYLTSQKDE